MDYKQKAFGLQHQLIAQGKIPKDLYKHTTITNLDKMLDKSTLWFAPPTSFNDPFDCQLNDLTNWTEENIREYLKASITMEGGSDDLEHLIKKNNLNASNFREFFTGVLKRRLSEMGVTCFLESPDNLVLWAHYSDNHKGVCVKFDIRMSQDCFWLTRPVIYSEEYPKFDYLTDKQDVVNTMLLTKSKHWEYEKEFRAIQLKSGAVEFDKESFSEIIFGCRVLPEEITRIKDKAEKIGYPNLKFKQMQIRQFEFLVDINDV